LNNNYRVGIAGYGVVGTRRRKFIDEHPAFHVVAVCDVSFIKSGIFSDGVKFHADYKDLLEEQLDVLFVCLPNFLAPAVTIAGLVKNLHVFCEKPPGRNLDDITRVIDVESKYPNLCLKYGFNHRYHHSVREALKLVHSGNLGNIINLRGIYGKSKMISYDSKRVKSVWRTDRAMSGGGILLDQGIHMVDMLRLFAGEFSEIHSFISNNYWNYDVEDNAYALMRTENGIVAMLHSSATLWRHCFQLDITLERGMISLNGILSSSKSYGSETIMVTYASNDDAGDPLEKTTRFNDDPSWRDEIYDFADAIIKGRKIKQGSSIDAYKTMDLVHRIYNADHHWKSKYL
jgi:predicted dehydrogenase